MSLQENFYKEPDGQMVLEVGKPLRPFEKMKRSFTGGKAKFSKVYLNFGGVDFEMSVSQNEGLDVDNEKDGSDIFYTLQLNGRIPTIDKLKWLNNYVIKLTVPPDCIDKAYHGYLTTLYFYPLSPFNVDPKTQIKDKGYADLFFETDIYDFAFQNDVLRSQIEMLATEEKSSRAIK